MGLVYGKKGDISKNKLIFSLLVPNVNSNYNVLNCVMVGILRRILHGTFESSLDWLYAPKYMMIPNQLDT